MAVCVCECNYHLYFLHLNFKRTETSFLPTFLSDLSPSLQFPFSCACDPYIFFLDPCFLSPMNSESQKRSATSFPISTLDPPAGCYSPTSRILSFSLYLFCTFRHNIEHLKHYSFFFFLSIDLLIE